MPIIKDTPDTPDTSSRRDGVPVNDTEAVAEKTKAYFEVEPREYDVGLIEEFLDLVFHTPLQEQEETLMWVVPRGSKPVYPIPEGQMFDTIEGSKVPKALYYGTATAHRDSNGKLFNRQELFERLHVIVLDDIGTKIDPKDLPEGMTPTYIVESSKDNFQYGFVFEEPIDDLAAAKALVSIMYDAGISDSGGKMPNKLVRLPEGINGKKGEKCGFVTRLVSMDGPLWSPQGLLDALDCKATWEEIQTDALEATKRRARLKGGSTPWAPYRPKRASISGIIDPVVEWLDENNQVISESGDWVTVRCPFSDGHTTGDDTAGYKPLGVGDDPNMRGFHCFHDSCTGMHTRDFLQHVSLAGGPSVGVQDEVSDLVSSYVYDVVGDCAWKIKDTSAPKLVSMSGMSHGFPRKSLVASPDGKLKAVSEFSQWLHSESRVLVSGTRFAPSTPARLVEGEHGDLHVNLYSPPAWGTGVYNEDIVGVFKRFLEYLIPNAFEREYFTDWLAAKVQDMGFRGAAVVMVAQRQGIGRSTLADFIGTLLGEHNVRNEPFAKVVGDSEYNEWVEAPFVVSDETLNSGGLNSYKTYEKLKDMIDPRPKLVTINPKYGKQRRTMVHSTFLFLSNHSNALAMSADDRRFFVVSNPHTPRNPQYFRELNAWADKRNDKGQPFWAEHVYRWLMEIKPDMERLLSPPELTAGKAAMIDEGRGAVDVLTHLITQHWPTPYISFNAFKRAMEHFAERTHLYDLPNYNKQLKHAFHAAAYPLAPASVIKVEGHSERFRVFLARSNGCPDRGDPLTVEAKAEIRAKHDSANIAATLNKIAAGLDAAEL